MNRYSGSHIDKIVNKDQINEDQILKIARDGYLSMVNNLEPEFVEEMTRYSDEYNNILRNEGSKLRTMQDFHSYMVDNPTSEDSQEMIRYSGSYIDKILN